MTAVSKTRAACLIGWPAAHSRSPLIHHYWLRTLGIEGGYNIEAVPPEDFAEFVLHLSRHGFVGANVTIPHKERALALIEAGRTGARGRRRQYAVVRERRIAFDQHRHRRLHQQSRRLRARVGRRRRCAGAGRRRCVARGRVRLARARHQARASGEPHARTGARAGGSIRRRRRSGAMGCDRRTDCRAQTCWSTRPRSACTASPRSNSTSACCRRHAVVADLVYVPLETPLLAAARARGLKTADGLGMLLHQAVRGFELWFGQRPEVTPELRALVEADLTNV